MKRKLKPPAKVYLIGCCYLFAKRKLFHEEKGPDPLSKLLKSQLFSQVVSETMATMKSLVQKGVVFEHHGQQQFTATAFSAKLTSCIVQMVKDVFWGFVYAEKLDQENKEQDLSTGSEDREYRHSAGQ